MYKLNKCKRAYTMAYTTKTVEAQITALQNSNTDVLAWDLAHVTRQQRKQLAKQIAKQTGCVVKFVGATMMVDADALAQFN